MKSRDEIEELKRQWLNDPSSFDLENCEGFEEHQSELLYYRLYHQLKWNRENEQRLVEKSVQLGIPGNTQLAQFLMNLRSELDYVSNSLSKRMDCYEKNYAKDIRLRQISQQMQR